MMGVHKKMSLNIFPKFKRQNLNKNVTYEIKNWSKIVDQLNPTIDIIFQITPIPFCSDFQLQRI